MEILWLLGGALVGWIGSTIFHKFAFYLFIQGIIERGEWKPKSVPPEFQDAVDEENLHLIIRNTETNEEHEFPNLPMVPMYVEREDGMIYGYRDYDNQFMCKGRDFDSFVTAFLENHPDTIAQVAGLAAPDEITFIAPGEPISS